jgi:hypothetical protein
MRSFLVNAMFLAAFAAAGVTIAPMAARAGGGSFDTMDDDDADSGPPFVGDVKDKNGGAGIPDAKVIIAVKAFNSSLILRTDDQGHFNVKGFDKSVDPEEVDFSCSADGYKFFARTKTPTGDGPRAPITVTCLVEKQ